MATKHINECMDRERRQRAPSRPQERCPFCGQSLRDLSDRQRQLHDQTCRKTSAVQEADVVHYPKVVESLPTPAEWEIVQEVRPVFVNNEPMVPEDIPVFGVLMRLGDLQSLTGFQFTNHPIPASIEDLDIDSETEL
jgi:hypothetical protein